MEQTLNPQALNPGDQFINGLRASLNMPDAKISLHLPHGREFLFSGADQDGGTDQSDAIDLEIDYLGVRRGKTEIFTDCDFKGKGGSNMAWSPKKSVEAIRILVSSDGSATDIPNRIVRLNKELAEKYSAAKKPAMAKLADLLQRAKKAEKLYENLVKHHKTVNIEEAEKNCLELFQEYYDLQDLTQKYDATAKILKKWKVENLEILMNIKNRTSGTTHRVKYRVDATIMPLMNTEAPITVAAKFIAIFDYFKFTGRVVADGFLKGNIGIIDSHIIINDKNACAQAPGPIIPGIKQVTASPAGKQIVRIYDDCYSISFQKSVEYSNVMCGAKDTSLKQELFTGAGMLQLILCELFLKNISATDLAKRKFRTAAESKEWITIAESDLAPPSEKTIAELSAKYESDSDFAKVIAALNNIKKQREDRATAELANPLRVLFDAQQETVAAAEHGGANAAPEDTALSPITVVATPMLDSTNLSNPILSPDGNDLFAAAQSANGNDFFAAASSPDSNNLLAAACDNGQSSKTTRTNAKRKEPHYHELFYADNHVHKMNRNSTLSISV